MDGTIGEIRLFAGDFAPRNWEFCDGRTMATSFNPALFSVIGIQFGGDGVTNFKLPDFRGRTIIHPNDEYPIGSAGGEVQHTLTIDEIPGHTHIAYIRGSANLGTSNVPTGRYLGSTDTAALPSIYVNTNDAEMNSLTVQISNAGNGAPHDNMQPYLGLNFIICTHGLYPTHN